MISTLILTLNEELNLPACLESVRDWSNDIIVLDSYSSDKTVQIAKDYGARVYQRAWDNELAQRQHSLRLDFLNRWVYNPDADEICTQDMAQEMQRIAENPDRREVAYRVRFKVMFMNRWIRYSSLYPTWVMRLFDPKKITLSRQINLQYDAEGPVGRLESHFLHYTFSKGLTAWFHKHNEYSQKEAEETLRSLSAGNFQWKELLSRDTVLRRRALKELSFRVPFRPTLRFLYSYLWKRGFLDGRAGLTYCRLIKIYESMIELKIKEIQADQAKLQS